MSFPSEVGKAIPEHLTTSDGSAPSITFELVDRAVLDALIREYQKDPHTPELVTRFNRTLWNYIGQISGVDVTVPDFPSSKADIDENEKKSEMIIYLPEQFVGEEARFLLLQAFDLVNNKRILSAFNTDSEARTYVRDEDRHSGYMYVESTVMTPHVDINEGLLKRKFKTAKREGMNLSDYLTASLYSKIVKGEYFDENPNNASRLLGSTANGGLNVSVAKFIPDGSLVIYWGTNGEDKGGYMGGRSVRKIS